MSGWAQRSAEEAEERAEWCRTGCPALMGTLRHERDEARAEVERLRAEVERLRAEVEN